MIVRIAFRYSALRQLKQMRALPSPRGFGVVAPRGSQIEASE